ncbi:MAG: nuclear transport factor 2 family protein, partial [Saprospiraceae bacterium]
MPSIQTVTAFIKAVETLPHPQVIEQFYAKNASMQENQLPPRVGKKVLITNEKAVYHNVEKVYSKCILPFFVNDNHAVIRWKFRFDWKNGT